MIIGVCSRNDYEWPESDFHAISKSGVQVLKTMSHTSPVMYEKARAINPDIQFIVRLYLPDFGVGYHPQPKEFVDKLHSQITSLSKYTDMFAIHNEPNHPARYEGWGMTDEDAISFKHWFLETYLHLKIDFPDLQFGFPGLAVPHRDLEWLNICRPAIEEADFLGVHCYWQYDNHLSNDWGLRVLKYVEKYPDKDIHILEAGNSNMQNNIPLSEDTMSQQLVEWYNAVSAIDNVKSASPFILSSQDPYWDQCGFTWIAKDGRFKKIIYDIGELIK